MISHHCRNAHWLASLAGAAFVKVTATDKAVLQSLKAGLKIDLDGNARLVPPSVEPSNGL